MLIRFRLIKKSPWQCRCSVYGCFVQWYR